MNDIVIIGAGGFGREVQWLIERINEQMNREAGKAFWNILGYIDDGCAIDASKTGKKVIGKIKSNENRSFLNLIDPSVYTSSRIKLSIGNIICAEDILTVNISVEDFCIINLDCTVVHDASLSSFVMLYPCVNISGNTYFGECVELGTGTQIIQGKTVGLGTIVGARSVVVRDLPGECTAVRSPCKLIKYHVSPAIGGILNSNLWHISDLSGALACAA